MLVGQVVRLLQHGRALRAAQAHDALRSATERLGAEKARLSLQGDRATLTLTGVTGEQLSSWLGEARSGARARPVEAQLLQHAHPGQHAGGGVEQGLCPAQHRGGGGVLQRADRDQAVGPRGAEGVPDRGEVGGAEQEVPRATTLGREELPEQLMMGVGIVA